MVFPVLLGFMVFVVLLAIILRRNSHIEKEAEEAFWQKEYEANKTRRQDLSLLDYIKIPVDKLPFGCCPFPEIQAIEEQITELSKKRIFNFEGATNTELKAKYGTANLDELIQFDEAFINLVRLLNEWGISLYDMEMLPEAKSILEFAVDIKSDIPATYVTLAKIYKREKEFDRVEELTRKAAALKSTSRESVLKKLELFV